MGKDAGGYFNLVSTNGTNNYNLTGYTNGILSWSGLSFVRTVNDSELQLCGATNYSVGASVILYGKDTTGLNGLFRIRAAISGMEYTDLCGYPNGTLTWGSKHLAMQEDTVPRSGGAVITGGVLGASHNYGSLRLDGGTGYNDGASIGISGKNRPDANGMLSLHSSDGSNYKTMELQPNGTWTWDGTAVQLTSDKRLKQQISKIDNALLDAWEDVTPCQFKYNDAVNEKGDNARLHTGYVVQQINDACQKHDVDISDYGLYCHEEYPERTEEVTIENEDGTTTKETKVIEEASEHYSLRYTETLVVECAYLRRENSRLKERLSKIEKLLNI